MSKTLTKADLAQFTGSENWYNHTFARHITYTDGVRHVAKSAGAYWLLDEIALVQPYEKALQGEAFQAWKLTVDLEEQTGKLVCDDGNGKVLLSKEIPYTDFPLDELTLFFTNNTILLPSEY